MNIPGIIVVIVLLALPSCAVDTATSEQTLCTIEDQQSASCPDSVWRIPYTRDTWRAAAESTATPSVSCSSPSSGQRFCQTDNTWVTIDSYVYTTCLFDYNPESPYASCTSVRCTVYYPPCCYDSGPYTSCEAI